MEQNGVRWDGTRCQCVCVWGCAAYLIMVNIGKLTHMEDHGGGR